MTHPRPPGDGLGAGLVVLAAVCFATLGPTSRFAEDAGVNELTLVAWRAVIGALFIAGTALVLGRASQVVARPWWQIPRRELLVNIGAGVVNAALNLAVLLAIYRISIALALLVFYTYPALVALVSAAWFGDRLDTLRWGALGVSLIGLVLVLVGAGQMGPIDLVGVGLAFLGAVGQVFYALSARHGYPSVPAPQAGGVVFAVAALTYLVVAGVTGQVGVLGDPLASSAALWPVLFAGVVGAGIPTMAWIIGIRLLGPPRAAIISTLEPVVGVALAVVLLAEIPTPLQVVGGACIVGAAIVVQRRPGVPATEHEAVADGEGSILRP